MEAPIENVDGRIVEEHTFVHEVQHQVNWSHVMLALAALTVVYYLQSRAAESDDEPLS